MPRELTGYNGGTQRRNFGLVHRQLWTHGFAGRLRGTV